MRTFELCSIQEGQRILHISYENSHTDQSGMFRLMKEAQAQLGGTIQAAGEAFTLLGGSAALQFNWRRGEGLNLRFLDETSPRKMQDIIYLCMGILNNKDMQHILNQLNAFLEGRLWFDFMTDRMGEDLHIIGSFDLCYYQELEVTFESVSFLQCSTSWTTSPADDTVFSLANAADYTLVNSYPIDCGYSALIKIKPDDSDQFYFIACHGISYSTKRVTFHMDSASKEEKSSLINKYGLFPEKDGWYQQKENSHKHLIFRNDFYQRSDLIGLLFRLQKLCVAKTHYFRQHLTAFEPYKYHYKNGFVKTSLWDSEFLKHKASGYLLDYRSLQAITKYTDFERLTKELESFEPAPSLRTCL